MRADLPSGTVTFLFTDIEGSTKLLHELGADAYAEALAEHRRAVRGAVARHGGVEVDTQGDAFFVAFPTAPGALAAVAEALAALEGGPIRVRMGLHTGTPLLADEGYVGADVHRAARIAACGHGGQVLVSSATAALVDPHAVRDLGEHRLKDLSAPERIFQVGDREFPRLKSLHQTNLPIPATTFVGRERELAEIRQLVAASRLVTMTGPGGTGKTRLALQAAAEAADAFPDGVWWVPLAAIRDAQLVPDALAGALGATDGLAEHIGVRSMLLLLDNFEQVIDAADGLCSFLASCPNLRLLVTSRELLRVPGEQAYPVPPLVEEEGVALFDVRAREALPGFAPIPAVADLCRRLENLPLAIELAAARVRVLGPEQLLDRLGQRLDLLRAGRGVDPRQQTLRATIEWSYELLSPEDQRLFGRLAVFAGGWSLESAELICEATIDTLESLVDKSLVRARDGRRFWMLETIREFASEQLDIAPDAREVRDAHAGHFLALAEEAEPELPAYPREWISRLDEEHANLRAALDWFETTDDASATLQMTGALARFWMMRGHVSEGFRRIRAALAGPPARTAVRARALVGAAMLGGFAEHDAARAGAEEALSIYEEIGDRRGIGLAKLALGGRNARGDMNAARRLYAESAEAFEDAGDAHHALIATRHHAWACAMTGDVERSRELHERNLRRARELGNERIEAITLGALSVQAIEEGRGDEAFQMLVESHRLHMSVDDPFQSACDVARFAFLLASRGAAEPAARVLSAADALAHDAGASLEAWDSELVADVVAKIRANLGGAAFEAAWAAGRDLSADDAVALARATVS